MSVEYNLRLSATGGAVSGCRHDGARLRVFPRLAERRRQAVRTMSGGEQQMVAIGRALMTKPSLDPAVRRAFRLAPARVIACEFSQRSTDRLAKLASVF